MLSDADMYARMAAGWRGGAPFTVCGNGSLPRATVTVREALPKWCKKYHIATVHDAGAGDMRWRVDMKWDVIYRPFDLVPRDWSTTKIDISTEALPECDLILCRMVLNHIAPRVPQTLELFRKSGKFLAATQYNGGDLPQRSPQYVRMDLRPWLGQPLEQVSDGLDHRCTLALWRLN